MTIYLRDTDERSSDVEHAGRCAYEHVFDAADERDADESPPVWRCPHPASDGTDRCLFHRPVEETRPAAVTEALREAVEDDARPSAFVGGAFEHIDLAGVTPGSGASLDFRGAMVKADIDLRDATLDGRPATVEHGPTTSLSWNCDGYGYTVRGTGVETDRLLEIGRSVGCRA